MSLAGTGQRSTRVESASDVLPAISASSPWQLAGLNRAAFLVWLLMVPLFSGCATVDMQELPSMPMFEEKPKEVPTRIIPVWTDSVLHRGGKAVRGFGGRVVFYGEETEQPIEVDGVMIVYAWNDSKPNNREKPDRKFVFKAEMLPKHYSRSKIGDSYSFWLPWDEVGGDTRHVTLVTRFISLQGGEVTSTAARVVLPGPLADQEEPEPSEPGKLDPMMAAKAKLLEKARRFKEQKVSPANVGGVRQASFETTDEVEQVAGAQPNSTVALDATTINLPIHLAYGSDTGANEDIIDLNRSAEPERWEPSEAQVGAQARQRYADRFVRDRPPVRSWRSDQRSAFREQTPPDRSVSLTGAKRSRTRAMTVQQKIAQDAAEAKARRDELWGQKSNAAQEPERFWPDIDR